MSVVCAACGKLIKATAYFCPSCRVHFGWDCTNSGRCRRCGATVLRMG
jgi:predicted amidophosphoribosyltransferase